MYMKAETKAENSKKQKNTTKPTCITNKTNEQI